VDENARVGWNIGGGEAAREGEGERAQHVPVHTTDRRKLCLEYEYPYIRINNASAAADGGDVINPLDEGCCACRRGCYSRSCGRC